MALFYTLYSYDSKRKIIITLINAKKACENIPHVIPRKTHKLGRTFPQSHVYLKQTNIHRNSETLKALH